MSEQERIEKLREALTLLEKANPRRLTGMRARYALARDDRLALADTPTDTQGEGWRYFWFANIAELWRIPATHGRHLAQEWTCERWQDNPGGNRSDARWWETSSARELTEAEAVERFGPEIRDEQDKGEGLYLNGKKLPTHGPCPATTEDDTPHARALRELDLQPGDRVKVARKVPSYDGGWGCHWSADMDITVRSEGDVFSVGPDGVNVDVLGLRWNFPAHALSLVSRKAEEEQPQPREDKPKTLADYPPYMLCREIWWGGSEYHFWRDDLNRVYMVRKAEVHKPAIHNSVKPSGITVGELLGPVHVSAETRSRGPADAEREELRELREKVQRLEAENYELEDLRDGIGAKQDEDGEWLLPYYKRDGSHELMPLEECLEARRSAGKAIGVLQDLNLSLITKNTHLSIEADKLALTLEKAHEERDELAELNLELTRMLSIARDRMQDATNAVVFDETLHNISLAIEGKPVPGEAYRRQEVSDE